MLIGKSAGGWRFLFKGFRGEYGGPRIESYAEWRNYLATAGGTIKDEYGRELTVDELFEHIDSWRDGKNHALVYPATEWRDTWVDADGWPFSAGEWS
jgi:hypothetical protein